MELKRIYDDLYHIAKRLRKIDRNYKLYFNRAVGRYEIYAKGAMQMALPFERLDARTLEYARKTRIENIERIIGEIERDNARLEEMKKRLVLEKMLAESET